MITSMLAAVGTKFMLFLVSGTFLAAALLPTARAVAADDFSLQVTPSPLVSTLKPGLPTQLELKVRNAGIKPEELKIEPRGFTVGSGSEQVSLGDTTPADIAQWVSFSNPTFIVQPGQWYTQKITISLPKDAGFSYAFALLISRKSEPKSSESGRLLKGSVAVFTLVNVDRDGATRKLETVDFKSTRGVYEYAPATFNVKLKNTGNSIVQPYGNIFIQRGNNDSTPISTLPVNEKRGYILPGSTRTLSSEWIVGFPLTKTSTDSNGKPTQSTEWNWAKVSDFRIGRYTARLVAVYNDGHRDVPVDGTTTFWIIPWKIILGAFVVLSLILFGLWSVIRKTIKLVKHPKKPSTPEA